MKEYKIIHGNTSECQKWLNQWKHEFNLDIIQMTSDKFTDEVTGRIYLFVTILLTKEKYTDL